MNTNNNKTLSKLSQTQINAVTYIDGHLLILAGAGSGKTRVLTHKIAWLISENIVRPENIMAVTFTNKAAGEMRTRIDNLVGGKLAAKINAGTFHGYGLRFLFRYREAARKLINLREGFTVFDRDDSRSLISDILSEHESTRAAAETLDIISRDYISWTPTRTDRFIENPEFIDIADEYRSRLRNLNAVDFDDLMILPLQIMHNLPQIRQREQDNISWLLVDEYQDVNQAQALLLKYLVGTRKNCIINAVGDPDQSIYGWRGANVDEILNFTHEFPNAKIIKLEENYRSTKNILDASNALIRNNRKRLKKNLFTAKKTGDKIKAVIASSDLSEADYLVCEIERLRRLKCYRYGNIAILYRQNSMSRVIEKKFLENDIPYRIVRGVSFYERMEVKDVLAILKLALNPTDILSMERVSKIHSIIEGMGPKSQVLWSEWLDNQLAGVLNNPLQLWTSVSMGAWNVKGKAGKSMQRFAGYMCGILNLAEEGIRSTVDYILYSMGYSGHLLSFDNETYHDRLSNVNELKSIVPDGDLRETLAEAALFTDADTIDDNDKDCVGLMTIHASKGLEFPVVFIVGMEEGIFPHNVREECKNPEEDLEEERRLCYVGMTRAEEKLYMTAAKSRMMYGNVKDNDLSRFILEVPDDFIDIDDRAIFRNNCSDTKTKKYRLW